MNYRRRLWVGGAVALLATLLAGFAFLILESQAESRHGLEDRFSLRANLAARFTASVVDSVVQEERLQAARRLSERDVSDGQFRQVVEVMDFEEAVLLDARGRVLKTWPANPELIGRPIARKDAYLRTVLAGARAGVSNVVPSARGRMIAFAVPFQSEDGRRVFSGALAIIHTPLDVFLRDVIPIRSSEVSIIDASGFLVSQHKAGDARESALTVPDPSLVRAIGRGPDGTYQRAGEERYFTRHSVDGTPWQLVASVSEDALFAPVSGLATVTPWILFGAFVAAVATMLALFHRLGQQRARLATSNKSLAGSNRSLADSNEELRDLDRLKDEFVALVSHELRTPLTSIIGYVRLLLRGRAGPLPQEQRELLGVVERNALRLLRLIGDLLLAAKVDAGKLELEPEDLDLDVLAAECVESAQPAAQSRGVTLGLEVGGEVPVYCDRARIVQLLDNLISNAIKFTLDGGRVDVRVVANGVSATIEVTDSGIGIPAEEQARLFERFFRASTATAREIQGSGLGLSVVKTIVELHGGTVEFSSVEGVGTTFRVDLPLRQPVEVAA